MNRKMLAVWSLVGLAMWIGIIQLLDHFFAIDWAETGRLCVMLLIGIVLGGTAMYVVLTTVILGDALDPGQNDVVELHGRDQFNPETERMIRRGVIIDGYPIWPEPTRISGARTAKG